MTISPVEFYAKPDAKDARIAELEEALREIADAPTSDVQGWSYNRGYDDAVRAFAAKARTALKETDQ